MLLFVMQVRGVKQPYVNILLESFEKDEPAEINLVVVPDRGRYLL